MKSFIFNVWIAVLFLCCAVFGVSAFADAAIVADPTFLDSIIKALQNINPMIIAGIVTALEIGMRLVPSLKPLSLLVPMKYVVSGLIVILSLLESILAKLIAAANITK